jgi:SAM-dependent methyltransferase
LHRRLVGLRRVERLAEQIAPLLPPNARVLDLGAGDGAIARAVLSRRPDLTITALEVKIRHATLIQEIKYDGHTIPFREAAFDCVILIDVVHHTWNPVRVLAEARRVAGYRVILKDHVAGSSAARLTLSFMDWVSNAEYGINMPYTYWSRAEWSDMLTRAGLEVESWSARLHLYPFPASKVFDGSLQFIASLMVHGTHARRESGARPGS